jgi:hypothetical protein
LTAIIARRHYVPNQFTLYARTAGIMLGRVLKRAVTDVTVIREWESRNSAYRSRSSWLRIPFYLGVGLIVPAFLFLPRVHVSWFIGLRL